MNHNVQTRRLGKVKHCFRTRHHIPYHTQNTNDTAVNKPSEQADMPPSFLHRYGRNDLLHAHKCILSFMKRAYNVRLIWIKTLFN
jgi:hypothetical protein